MPDGMLSVGGILPCERAEAGEPRLGGHLEQRAERSPGGKQERQALSEGTLHESEVWARGTRLSSTRVVL